MRASLLTLLLLLLNPENTLIASGGNEMCKLEELPKIKNSKNVDRYEKRFRMNCTTDYVRRAGTSNLFTCKDSNWFNQPPLQCIADPKKLLTPKSNPTETQTHTPVTNATTGRIYTEVKTTHVTWELTKSTSTMSTPPTWKPEHTQRTTPAKEATTTSMITTTRSSTFSVSTSSSQSSSISTTNIVEKETMNSTSQFNVATKQGIAAGIILVLILSGGAVAAFIIRRQRSSRLSEAENAHYTSEMNQHPATVEPLLENYRADNFDA